MRTTTRNSKLNVLSLEDRLAPAATISLLNGNLTVQGDNATNTIALLQTGPTQFQVYVRPDLVPSANLSALLSQCVPSHPSFRGTYNVTGQITVNGGNSRDQLVIFVDPAFGQMSNNVRMSAGNSADDINIASTSDTLPATIAGNVTLNGGFGADNFFLNLLTIQGSLDVTGGGNGTRPDENNRAGDYARLFNVVVQGNAFARDTSFVLDDFFSFPIFPSAIQGNLIVSNPTMGANSNFNWGVESNNAQLPFGLNSLPTPFPVSSLIGVAPTAVVGGDVIVTGGAGAEAVYILGTVNGRVTAALGAGENRLHLSLVTSVSYNASIAGDVTFVSSGNNNLNFGDALISGAVSLNTGNGSTVFGLGGNFFVNGSFNITAGNAADNIAFGAGSFIGGNLSVNAGSGNNTITLAGTVSGNNVQIQAAGGNNTVNILSTANAFGAQLKVYLGGGNDTVNLDSVSFASAYLDGGFGTDTFNPTVTIPINWTIVNF
jgi:hypothetical protein